MAMNLVLSAEFDTAVVANYFKAIGWNSLSELPDLDQQPDNDRLLGVWQAPDGASAELVSDGLIHWLEFRDAQESDRAAVAGKLPCLDTAAIESLLIRAAPDEVLAGIRAARVLGDPKLAPALAALHQHPEESVRTEAFWALQAMVPHLIDHGVFLLRERARRQGANPLWESLQPGWFKRQTLRWLLWDHPQPAPGLESTLRAALMDPDWEVRAGAMIGAVRYRLRALGGLVEKCGVPHVSRDGPDAKDRAMLRALKEVGCALLAGRVPPALGPEASPKARALDRLAKFLTARTHTPDDRAGLLVHALTTPTGPSDGAVPLPSGVMEDASGPHCGGLRLVKVPLVSAWLGDGEELPIRAARGGGFFIAEEPIAEGAAPLAIDAAAALEWCRRNAARSLRLPTVDEWEIAVRGNDGRRFPWGNGFQHDGLVTPGPWGTWGHGSSPEWALTSDGSPVCCGPRCAQRQPAEKLAHLRPIVG